MLIKGKRQSGVTLVELLIGMLIGVIVVAGALSVFMISLKGQGDNIQLARLNQDIRAMMDIMARDIRRASFVTDIPENYNAILKDNPFFQTDNDLTIHDFDNGEDNCILYSYNRDNDKPPVVDADERFGFRLNDDGELEMRRSGTTNEACDNTAWRSITEPIVIITELKFSIEPATLNATSMTKDINNDGCYDGDMGGETNDECNYFCDPGELCNVCNSGEACLYIRDVTIKLTGRLRNQQSSVPQAISERVRVRNDKFVKSF